jgi:hypothetical protein
MMKNSNPDYKETMWEILLELKIKRSKLMEKFKEQSIKDKIKPRVWT